MVMGFAKSSTHPTPLPLRRAIEAQPDNIRIQVALAETEYALGHAAEADKLATIVKNRIATGEKIPPNLKARSDALAARVPAK